MTNGKVLPLSLALSFFIAPAAVAQSQPSHPIVLHAARLLDVKNGKLIKPGEILVEGERIVEVGASVKHPPEPKSSISATALCCPD